MTTEIVNDRETAIRVGYKATEWRAPVDEKTYRAFLEGWSVKAIVRDGQCIGAVFRNENELHVSILPEWRRRWLTKGLLRQLIDGTTTSTRVTFGHEYMHDILRRLGFVKLEDNTFVRGH